MEPRQHTSSQFPLESHAVVAPSYQPCVGPNPYRGNHLMRPIDTNLPRLDECNINSSHAVESEIPGTSGSLLTEDLALEDQPHPTHFALDIDQHTDNIQNPQHASTALTHPRPSPPSIGTHIPIIETSHAMSEFLNVSREDPWTPQFPRFEFQSQQSQNTSTEQQKLDPLLRFLSGCRDDPWTSECPGFITTQVMKADLDRVDRLFGMVDDNGGRVLESQY